jgi:hypothetical protein
METTFPEGIRAFKPTPNAPQWIISDLTINKAELLVWLQNQPNEVKLQVCLSKKDTFYLRINDWKPTEKPTHFTSPTEEFPSGINMATHPLNSATEQKAYDDELKDW